MDDGIITHAWKDILEKQVREVRSDLYNCRLVVNEAKSEWESKQKIEWQGILVDLKKFLFVAPEEKIKDLSERIRTVLAARSVTSRRLASLIGKITALYEK